MYNKNRSFIYSDAHPIFEKCGQEKGMEILLHIREALETMNAFERYDTNKIREIANGLARSILQGEKC